MDLTTLISNLGFPIAVCVVMFWYINKKDDQTNTTISGVTAALNSLSEKISAIFLFVTQKTEQTDKQLTCVTESLEGLSETVNELLKKGT